METAAAAFGIDIEIEHFDWACADYCRKHDRMMPKGWFDRLKGFDAIYFGAVGWPETVPDHVSLCGSLFLFRRGFDQYVNLRPARLMPGVASPLADRKVGDIDMMIVRENTEGEYSTLGKKTFEGTDREFVLQESVFTRVGVDRVLKFAFEIGGQPAEETFDVGDQIEWHRGKHAVLGRASRSDGPIATNWSGAMMLDFLGNGQGSYRAAHDAIVPVANSI